MVLRLLAIIVCIASVASPAQADLRSVYTIRDIAVSEQAETVLEAQQNAFADARAKAANLLIQRITLASDRAKVGGVYIDPELAQSLASAVDVQEETRGGGRYVGTLSVVLNPQKIRPLLRERGVPFVDRQAPPGLLVPVSANSATAWAVAWGERDLSSLAPHVVAYGSYASNATWQDIEAEATLQNVSRGIVAVLQGADGAYRVQLRTVTPASNEFLGTTSAQPTLQAAIAAAKRILEGVWKRDAIIRGDERTLVSANVFFTSIGEWNGLRRALAQSPRVSEFGLEALSRDGAVVNFAFAGEIDKLTNDLRQRGVALDPDPEGWILTSAAQAAP